MCKFALVSNDLTMFRKGEIEDLMYDIQGNISLIKIMIYVLLLKANI